jgi:hypothetical protein
MKSFIKALCLVLALALPVCGFAHSDDGSSKKSKGKGKVAGAKSDQTLDVPIPVGHDATKIKLPLYGEDGKLQMKFAIEKALRVDDDHLQMGLLKLETFDADGKPAMSVEMKSSVLDLKTHVITSNEETTVKRVDFEITGNQVEFDTKARTGRFIGQTRMLIYNLD